MKYFNKNKDLFGGSDEWDESKHPRDEQGRFTQINVLNEGNINFKKNTKLIINDYDEIYQKAIFEEPTITKDIKEIAYASNLELIGLENRLKSEESFKRKYNMNKNKQIRDIIRYTALSTEEHYVKDINNFIDNLRKKGYNTIVVKNTWYEGATY